MESIAGALVIAGLAAGAAKPAAELVKDFVGRVVAPSGDALGAALANPIVEWQKRRVERASRLVLDAATAMAEAQLEPHPVPGRVLLPILERASLEDDDTLWVQWTALLANAAADPDSASPAYATILSELIPSEALLLDLLYSADPAADPPKGVTPVAAGTRRFGSRLERTRVEYLMKRARIDDHKRISVLLDNLERLRLVGWQIEQHRGEDTRWVETTDLGEAFVTSCRMPRPR